MKQRIKNAERQLCNKTHKCYYRARQKCYIQKNSHLTTEKYIKKSTYQQGLLGQTIPIEAPRKPIRYGRTISISSWIYRN